MLFGKKSDFVHLRSVRYRINFQKTHRAYKNISMMFFLSSYTESITVIRSRFVLVIRTDAEPARNGEFTRQGPMKRIV